MYQNPVLVEALVRDRVAELQQSAGPRVRSQAKAQPHRLIEAGRSATGWLLIDMGLRLAVPRGSLSHPVARAPR